jgi:aspartyl-tRNA(Asn)/glutamyl-tRNA(Gln) amidotransferase subunit B
MEEGSIRFDANVSVRPAGSAQLGTKVEIKNMNSFRSLERAVASEIERQIGLLEAAGTVTQETRHWDEEAGTTRTMRTKEGSSDYRYFTEPDLLPLVFGAELIDRLRSELPELPADRRRRFEELGIESATARVLSQSDAELRKVWSDATSAGADPAAAANWVTGELTAARRRAESTQPIDGVALAGLLAMVGEGKLSSSAAKEVLFEMLQSGGDAAAVAERLDLLQLSDTSAIEAAVASVLATQSDAVARYRAGEEKVVGFLVGQVMKATGGKADPKLVNEVLRRQLA